jgi:hypothetical protein
MGSSTGQILFRYGNDAALGAMDHRDRCSPIALARNSPVLEAIGNRGLPEAVSFGALVHHASRFRAGKAGKLARILDDAVIAKRGFRVGIERRIDGTDHGDDR